MCATWYEGAGLCRGRVALHDHHRRHLRRDRDQRYRPLMRQTIPTQKPGAGAIIEVLGVVIVVIACRRQ